MYKSIQGLFIIGLSFICVLSIAQSASDPALLTLDRIFSDEFRPDSERPIQWIEDGNAYVTIEPSVSLEGADELIRYDSKDRSRTTFLSAESILVNDSSMTIEGFSLSPDRSRVIIFTNSSRVWRSNTKGDYWVYDLKTRSLKQLGASFEPSSLMFAKFSHDNRWVYYVHDFNIYKEEAATNEVTQLTNDGTGDIINGTFDWVYEEEFGKRDGFSLDPSDRHLAFWRLDASSTGIFYMINNTDSIYSRPIPIQYPKVGDEPSAAKIGIIELVSGETHWIPLAGGERENYIPGIQWVDDDLLLIQQMNRHQNQLIVWAYKPSTRALRKVYTEKEDTWVDIGYPDVSANNWGNNDLPIVDDGGSFLRMTENDEWRHIYKIDIRTGNKKLITPTQYDVASFQAATDKNAYFIASPYNSTQRYLYSADLLGKGQIKRVTPKEYSGINTYNISPNGKYAIHRNQSVNEVRTVHLVNLPEHSVIETIVNNREYGELLSTLDLPEVKFTEVTTEDGISIDVRMVLPLGFDASKKYPVLFHVYGEPWGQVAVDRQIGNWDYFMAQQGYVVIDMDNRGTPCLKGSEWRKSIYRKIGVINVRDQAMAAQEILKLDYLDNDRTAVWGWSGGGSMSLNLMFQHPDIYGTGIAVAAVSNQLIYDNIYQERYMGLPQENKEDFINGSPVTHAKNLEGNLLL
ncbi:MAG: prolyl oligopeptidase family serine peptidase, partial [Flavobacteriales bacterium]|nr:prolyl oligopeptidase family serine peptidase [Flavobacteriales bacterium]